VRRNTAVAVTVRVSSVLAGEKVYRQRLVSGSWKTVASRTVRSDGSAYFTVPTTSKGTKYHRILVPATSAHAAKVSSSLRLRVS
jgi:hypothetical protein